MSDEPLTRERLLSVAETAKNAAYDNLIRRPDHDPAVMYPDPLEAAVDAVLDLIVADAEGLAASSLRTATDPTAFAVALTQYADRLRGLRG